MQYAVERLDHASILASIEFLWHLNKDWCIAESRHSIETPLEYYSALASLIDHPEVFIRPEVQQEPLEKCEYQSIEKCEEVAWRRIDVEPGTKST